MLTPPEVTIASHVWTPVVIAVSISSGSSGDSPRSTGTTSARVRQCQQGSTIRIADLTGPQRAAVVDELIALSTARQPAAAGKTSTSVRPRLHSTPRCPRGELRSDAEHMGPGMQVVADRPHMVARRNAHLDTHDLRRAVSRGGPAGHDAGPFHHDHRISARGDRRACHDAAGLARPHCHLRRVTRSDRLDNPQIARCVNHVGRPDSESVHSRVGELRDGFRRDDLAGCHQAQCVGNRHR